MKIFMSGSVTGALAGAAMLLPLTAVPASAQVPGGSYLQSCRHAHMRGNQLVATCRTEEGRWNQTSISNIGRCAGGIANADGRLVCGTRGGGFNVGSERERGRGYGWRGGYEGYGGSYRPYGPGRDNWGGSYGGPGYGWGSGYYGR
jgi:hypothetical protein